MGFNQWTCEQYYEHSNCTDEPTTGSFQITDADDRHVAYIKVCTKENARLMAASGALLEACRGWLKLMEDLDKDSEPDDKLADMRRQFHAVRIEKTRAAIALAEGDK